MVKGTEIGPSGWLSNTWSVIIPVCPAAPTSAFSSPLDSSLHGSWHVSRADADLGAPLALFLPTAWHFADLWLICTFSGYGGRVEWNPQIQFCCLLVTSGR